MVEFALTASLFLMMLLAFIDFGLLLYSWVTIQHATSEGARYGVTGQQVRRGDGFLSRQASIQKVIEDNAIVPRARGQQLDIQIKKIDISGQPVSFDEAGRNTTLLVTVTYPYKLFFPNLLGLNLTFNVTAHSVMRNEAFPRTQSPTR